MSEKLLKPGELKLAFPEYEIEPRAIDILRAEPPVIDFTANIYWYVYPKYRFSYVTDHFLTSLDEGAQPLERRTLYIGPERGTKPKRYSLRNSIDDYVTHLCNGVEIDYEAMRQYLEQHDDAGGKRIPTLDFIERDMKSPIEDLLLCYGNPGLKFREVGQFYRTNRDDNIYVRDYLGNYGGTLEECFGSFFSRRPSKRAISAGDLASVLQNYREPVWQITEEVDAFSHWAREVIKLEEPETGPLEKTFEILRRGTLRFRWVVDRLQLVPMAPSPLDYAYLWVVYRKMRGWSFKVCKAEDCNTVFLPDKRNQTYCDEKCANRMRMRRYRAKSGG